MDANTPPLKNVSKIALGAMGALFVLGIVFYKERALFADVAYAIFNMINDKSIGVLYQRYGALIIKLIPYLELKLHFPIKAIMMGYSISGYLFLLIVTALLVYVFKQYKFAILLSLYSFLIVSDSFFMLADTHTGIGWMFLFFAIIIHLGYKRVNMIVLSFVFILMTLLTITAHFILIIPTIFLWVYFILDKDSWPFSLKKSIFLSCLLAVLIAGKFMVTPAISYDSNHLYGITHISIHNFIDAFTKPVVTVFLYRCIINYWVLTIVFVAGIIYLAKERKIMLLVWTVISVTGYLALMGIAYADLDANALLCYIELEWVCLGIVAATPFVFTFLPKLKISTAAWLLAGIFMIRLVYIISSYPAFRLRDTMEEQILSQMRKKKITKLALFSDSHLMSIAKLFWALPCESTIESAIDQDKPQLTFFFVDYDDKQALEALKDLNGFYGVWGMTPGSKLNKEYFSIDTTNPYRIMTYAELME